MSEATNDVLAAMDRPERMTLTEEQRDRVRKKLAKQRKACGNCQNTEFEIGKALYLGFLWRFEDTNAYMIALTCTNPECSAPRTGLRLHERDFLAAGERTGAGESVSKLG